LGENVIHVCCQHEILLSAACGSAQTQTAAVVHISLYARVSGLDVGGLVIVRSDKFRKMEITERGIPGKRGSH